MIRMKKLEIKSKKHLAEVLKNNECYFKRHLKEDDENIKILLSLSEYKEVEDNLSYFTTFIKNLSTKDELKLFDDREDRDVTIQLLRKKLELIDFTLWGDNDFKTITNKSKFVLLKDKYRLYKSDFKIADGKLVSNNKIVIYEIFIKD